MAQSSDEPIPFIQYRDEKFVVCPEAQRMLSGVRDRIVVVCVAGPYRTGKSFLLNQLIGRAVERSTATTSSSSSSSGATSAAGFAVGSTVQACTKGIWLWGRPVRRNGRTFVFIDTEGLGSLDQSQSFDTQIFSLALLLSSLFVLNTTGAITETVLQELELVVECTKHIRAAEISESSGGATSTTDASGLANLAHYFPDFVWVLRDFSLELVDQEQNAITARQYLENALSVSTSKRRDARAEEKNRIRQTLVSVFPNRQCVTMVRPVSDEKDLKRLHSIPFANLRKEFRDQFAQLRSLVYEQSKIKRVDDAEIHGGALLHLASAYVTAMNGGAMPTIRTAWQSVLEIESRNAREQAEQAFSNTMSAFLKNESAVLDNAELLALQERAREQALATMRQLAVGDEEFKSRLEQELCAKIATTLEQHHEVNRLRSRALCTTSMQQAFAHVGGEAQLHAVETAAELEAFRKRLYDTYAASARGPMCDAVAREFLEQISNSYSQRMLERQAQLRHELEQLRGEVERLRTSAAQGEVYRNELQEAKARASQTQDELAACRARIQHLEQGLQHAQAQLADERKQISARDAQLQQQQEQIAQLEAARKQEQESVRSQDKQLKRTTKELERAKREAAELSKAHQQRVTELDQAREQVRQLTQQVQLGQQDGEHRVAQVQEQNKVLTERLLMAEEALAKARQEEQEALALAQQTQASIKSMSSSEKTTRQHLEQAQARARELEGQLSSVRNELQSLSEHYEALQSANEKLNAKSAADGAAQRTASESLQRIQRELDQAHQQAAAAVATGEQARRRAAELEASLQQTRAQASSESEARTAAAAQEAQRRIAEVEQRASGALEEANQRIRTLEAQVQELQQQLLQQQQQQAATDQMAVEYEEPPASVTSSSSSTLTNEQLEVQHEINGKTIQQLKSHLTALDVDPALVNVTEKKQYFIDLVYRNDPRLAGISPPPATPAKRAASKRR